MIVSDDGRIFRNTDMYEYTHQVDKVGYHVVIIKHHRYLVHRLVAQAFLNDYDELKDVHHIDKNKENNNVSNLRCIDSRLHQRLHKTKYSKIKHCIVCGKEFEPPQQNVKEIKYVPMNADYYILNLIMLNIKFQ